MRLNTVILGCCFLLSSVVEAGRINDGPFLPLSDNTIISLQGGFAKQKANHSLQFTGTDDQIFTYHALKNSKTTSFIGSFLGVEHPLNRENLFMQFGVEYNYFASPYFKGINTVGMEPTTLTLYNYQYKVHTHQVLLATKLRTSRGVLADFYPYISFGLGAAINRAAKYSAILAEAGESNLTPYFADKTNTAFSYSLGVGLEGSVSERVRLGLGWRFSDLGKVEFGTGKIIFNNYSFLMQNALSIPHHYVNQLVAHISYSI